MTRLRLPLAALLCAIAAGCGRDPTPASPSPAGAPAEAPATGTPVAVVTLPLRDPRIDACVRLLDRNEIYVGVSCGLGDCTLVVAPSDLDRARAALAADPALKDLVRK